MDVNSTDEAGPRDAGTTNAGFAEQRGRLGILRKGEAVLASPSPGLQENRSPVSVESSSPT
jgi:hypothetical protein